MKKFKVTYTITETRSCYCTAETKEETKEKWVNGDTDFDEHESLDDEEIIEIEEAEIN